MAVFCSIVDLLEFNVRGNIVVCCCAPTLMARMMGAVELRDSLRVFRSFVIDG